MLRKATIPVAAFFALAAAPMSSGSGVSFVLTTSAVVDGTARAPSSTKVQAMDGMLRFDGTDDAKTSGKGSYVLINPVAKTLSIVMPENKQYIEMNFGDSTGQAMATSVQVMANTTMLSDIQVSGSALGSGGSVNGHPTNRYGINMSYTEAVDGGKGQRKYSSTEEFWVTNDLKNIPDPMEAFTRAFGGKDGMPAVGGSVGELMRKRGDAQRRLFTGLPVKSVAKSTVIEADGSKTEQTTTTEISQLAQVNLDAAVFQVPAGYTKLDLSSLASAAGAQMRSALKSVGGDVTGSLAGAAKAGVKEAVDETKQEAKDATKNAAKEKAKCALGGMFGKKC